MFKVPHQMYTAGFKVAAAQRTKDGQGVVAVARELDMSTQTLRHWLKAFEASKLNGPGAKAVTAEQMGLKITIRSGGALRNGPPVKFTWIGTQCRQYQLAALCEVLGVCVNG